MRFGSELSLDHSHQVLFSLFFRLLLFLDFLIEFRDLLEQLIPISWIKMQILIWDPISPRILIPKLFFSTLATSNQNFNNFVDLRARWESETTGKKGEKLEFDVSSQALTEKNKNLQSNRVEIHLWTGYQSQGFRDMGNQEIGLFVLWIQHRNSLRKMPGVPWDAESSSIFLPQIHLFIPTLHFSLDSSAQQLRDRGAQEGNQILNP